MFSRSKGLGLWNYMKNLFQNPLEREAFTYKDAGEGAVFYPRDYRNPSPQDCGHYLNPLTSPIKQEGIAKLRYYNRNKVLFEESGGEQTHDITSKLTFEYDISKGERNKPLNLNGADFLNKAARPKVKQPVENVRRVEWAPSSDYL